MADPQISHEVDIHITDTAATALASGNKLEEGSSVTISEAHTLVARQNLNSDGHTKQSATWHEYSGSIEYRVIRSSATQESIRGGARGGLARYLHIIDNPTATTGQRKGYLYEIFFESNEENFSAGELVTGSASFKVSGAPTDIDAE